MKLYCPVCGFKCLSIFRKILFGPLLSVRCKECGNVIAVSWVRSLVSFLPAFAIAIASWFFYDMPVVSAIPFISEFSSNRNDMVMYGFAFGFVLFTVPMYMYWVSLELKRFCQLSK